MRPHKGNAPIVEDPAIAPPNSLEMEQSAIGALLFTEDVAIERGVSLLHPRHFYRRMHADMFQAVRRIMHRHRDASRVDFVCVYEELRAMGKAGADTFEYLRACVDICPSAVNIESYIRVVIAKSKLRHQLALGQRLEYEIHQPDADPTFLHNATQNATNAINTHGWCDLDAIFTRGK